ncbi:MAG: hypothetical protein G01um101429_568 [Parcubacteria group bacterium Gr01-1014_29]|nr:MAG: hypothetical protein G01um101429_568 [Parcubacteria group bacterium Gr01-1014_29]
MYANQDNQLLRAFFASRTVLVILFLLLIGAGVASFRALMVGWEVEAERREVEEEIQQLKAQKEALAGELADLHSGRGIEREAREKFNYRKPGEEVVIIVDSEGSSKVEEKIDSFSLLDTVKKIFNFTIFNFQ